MVKLDRKRRPISTLGPAGKKMLLEQLLGVWNANPTWGLGQLVTKAASIPSGVEGRVDRISDDDIQAGLDALTPLGWEVDELGAEEYEPVSITDVDNPDAFPETSV